MLRPVLCKQGPPGGEAPMSPQSDLCVPEVPSQIRMSVCYPKAIKGKIHSSYHYKPWANTAPRTKPLPCLPFFRKQSRAELKVVSHGPLQSGVLGSEFYRCPGTGFAVWKLNQHTHRKPSANSIASRLKSGEVT